MSHYKYLVFDAQYFLTRNFKQLSNSKSEGDEYLVNGKPVPIDDKDGTYKLIKPGFDYLGLAKSFFWSIAKFTRDYHSCDKVILCWDKYPYHKMSMLQEYKGDRFYATEEDLKDLDPIIDAQKIIDLKYEIETLAIKQKAKYWIITNFGRLGMPSFIRTGYEADDFGGAIAKYLEQNDPDARVGLVSIDSDWDYLIRPNADHLRPRGQVTTYQEMVDKHSKSLESSGVDLYTYKAMVDALHGSHNNMFSSIADRVRDPEEVVLASLVAGDTKYLKDVDLYNRQLKSFMIDQFPEYDAFLKSLYYLDKSGGLMDCIEYAVFTSDTKFGVSGSYYGSFISNLDQKLYSND